MYDIVIRGGVVVDGTGAPARQADVAVEDGRIAAVGPDLAESGREEIDAAGKLVTPGFVDIHTHYDGQVTWDEEMLPSSAHGVTTAVIGNCGIGFAPVRPGTEDWLITLMEGVEDIPGTVLHEGMEWSWESFPEYLDALARRRYAIDIAAHVPHSAVRAYVMGPRAVQEEATADDLEQMAAIVRGAVAAGAVGLGTSRIAMHQGSDGSPLPGTRAAETEVAALARAVRDAGGGVLQMVPSGAGGNVGEGGNSSSIAALGSRRDAWRLSEEVEMMRRLTQDTGLPVTFSLSENRGLGAAELDAALDIAAAAAAAGEPIYPQFSARPAGILSTLDTYHAFCRRPHYVEIENLPPAERARRMADPALKAQILGEADLPPRSASPVDELHMAFQRVLDDSFELAERPDYEPDPSASIAARARAEGRDPLDLLYDVLITDDGRSVVAAFATNYVDGDLSLTETIIRNDRFMLGLGDAGAHVRAISDGSLPTFIMAHWGRDRSRGPVVPLEVLVNRLTAQPAGLYGLDDRGVIAPGRRADINVIDMDRLGIGRPYLVGDLPGGGRRFLQEARGYDATLVAGVVTRRGDKDTGARPGRLVRNRVSARAAA